MGGEAAGGGFLHQRGRHQAREPRRAAPPLGRAVRVVVPQVDAVGQVRVAVEMVAATAAHWQQLAVGSHSRGHCTGSVVRTLPSPIRNRI